MKYAKNTSWLMGEKILRMFMGLFVGIWVARYLGPEQFGLLSYAQSFVFLFTAIATLGLDSIVVRELVKNEDKRDILLGTAFVLKFIGAIIILPLLWLGIQFTNNDTYTNILIFIIASATIFQSFNVIDFYYQSKVMSKYVALVNTVTLALSSLIKIILILNHAPLIAFAIMSVFDAIILAVGLIYCYSVQTKHKLFHWRVDIQQAKQLLKSSLPIMIAGVMFVTYSKIDQVMIYSLLGSKETGYFTASLRLVEPLYFIPLTLASSLFPAIIKGKEISVELYLSRMRKLVLSCLAPCLIICLIVTFSANLIVHVLYGEQFFGAIQVLSWQIWTLLLIAIGYINGYWLLNENLEHIVMINYSIAAFSNIVLNYFMIPKFGIVGAVYASLISQFIVYYVVLWFNSKTRYLVKNIYTLDAVKVSS